MGCNSWITIEKIQGKKNDYLQDLYDNSGKKQTLRRTIRVWSWAFLKFSSQQFKETNFEQEMHSSILLE